MTKEFKLQNWHATLFLMALGCMLYANTFDVPWYLDDYPRIVENPEIYSIKDSLLNIFGNRGLTNLTFALNYHFSGDNPASYHAVNIIIHLINAILVFTTCKKVFSLRALPSFFVSLIFTVHPIQTQAINYIVQRSTILSSTFFLLAILFFWKSSFANALTKRDNRETILYILSFISATIALYCKENSAILPIVLILIYFTFHSSDNNRKSVIIKIAPFFLLPVFLGFQSFVFPYFDTGSFSSGLGGIRPLTNLKNLSPLTYFSTQLQVYFLYIKLIFLPTELMLDYAFPIVDKILNIKSAISLLGIISLLYAAYRIRKRHIYIFFGTFWFFITLFIESSFIPLDPVFEHRLYLPLIGPVIALVASVANVSIKHQHKKALIITTLIILGIATWQRNQLWRDPIAFALDNAQKAPHSEGAWISLSGRYIKNKQYAKAIPPLKKALIINPDYVKAYINLSGALINTGEINAALDAVTKGLLLAPNDSGLLHNLAIIYKINGNNTQAIQIADKLIKRNPYNINFYRLKIESLIKLKSWKEAEITIKEAKKLPKHDFRLYYYLGITLYEQKRYAEALFVLKESHNRSPQNPDILKGIGLVALELRDFATVNYAIMKLSSINQTVAKELILKSESVKSNPSN